jgi:single-stranded DNA-binding protein
MNYQKIILVGNATDDAERRTSKQGNMKFTTFSMGVSDAKNHTTFFPITAFDPLGKAVAEYITKGKQVVVEGRVAVDSKLRFNVVANTVLLGVHKGVAHDDGRVVSERADSAAGSGQRTSEEAKPTQKDKTVS